MQHSAITIHHPKKSDQSSFVGLRVVANASGFENDITRNRTVAKNRGGNNPKLHGGYYDVCDSKPPHL